jgi:cytochrome c553
VSRAVKPAQSLASLEGVQSLPSHWRLSVNQLQQSAKRIGDSTDLTEAAAATADIGRACGLCHRSVAGPTVPLGKAPELDGTLMSRMRRHQWATERLWEGLYVPSEAAWAAGAAALELDPFAGDVLARGGVHARAAATHFASTTKTLAEAKSSESRGAAYAQLLTTCGPCHEAMGLKN